MPKRDTLPFKPEPRTPAEAWMLGTFLVGMVLGWLLSMYAVYSHVSKSAAEDAAQQQAKRGKARSLNPGSGQALRFVHPHHQGDSPPPAGGVEGSALRQAVEALLAREVASHHLARASVYYAGLDSGHRFDINPTAQYQPASLLKLPVLISWLRQADGDPGLLDRELVNDIAPTLNTYEDRSAPMALHAGHAYRIDDLLERMITASRNDAKFLLMEHIGLDALERLYQDLSLPPIRASHGDLELTARQVASMFHLLDAGLYLRPESAESALAMLNRVQFHEGLAAGVAAGIDIAHKFGVWTWQDGAQGGANEELHDCGIVYDPRERYILCVMTRGYERKALAGVVRAVSEVVAHAPTR